MNKLLLIVTVCLSSSMQSAVSNIPNADGFRDGLLMILANDCNTRSTVPIVRSPELAISQDKPETEQERKKRLDATRLGKLLPDEEYPSRPASRNGSSSL